MDIDNKYSSLFERTYIGNLGIKNRLVMAPIGTNLGRPDGGFSTREMDYFEERAKGGAGMLIIGFQVVTNRTDPFLRYLTTSDTDEQTKKWALLADRVKAHGTAVCLQLSAGLGRNAPPVNEEPLVSASCNPAFWCSDLTTRELTTEEIKDIVKCFGRAALRAKISGCDAVEIHAHIGYLLDQFMTPVWNRRTDQYGGSFENRMRFSSEVIEEIRKNVGTDFPVLYRMAIDHKLEGGRTIKEGLEIIEYLDTAGIDAFDIDAGCYEAHNWCFPTPYMGDACLAEYAAEAKKATSKPVLNAGNYTPETAVEAVKQGKTDFIMLGRGLLAEPEWGNKLLYGKRDELRPCIRCNEYCLVKPLTGRLTSCSINAACGSEKEYQVTLTDNPKNVVVIGGGPGGMEAARVAALKGHNVNLYEKNQYLGGQLLSASEPSFKSPLKAYLEYLILQMSKLDVVVHLNKEINADSPELESADTIIVAVGAKPFMPNIKGIDSPKAMTIIDAHLDNKQVMGENIIIAGGGSTGCECAIDMAMKGNNVTIVEMLPECAPNVFLASKICINEAFRNHNISVLTSHSVSEISETGVKVVDHEGKRTEIAADIVVLAFGMKPESKLSKSICDKYITAIPIGDCVSVGLIGEAVRRGFFAGWGIQ
ncbi:MAG: NAD(P)/FAD-dependent oxidoreductase [Proteobacteria bacterium]|nr:NAD(P)/FAD-dependent oxidoreductase [Pseudomonadota bacterium]